MIIEQARGNGMVAKGGVDWGFGEEEETTPPTDQDFQPMESAESTPEPSPGEPMPEVPYVESVIEKPAEVASDGSAPIWSTASQLSKRVRARRMVR